MSCPARAGFSDDRSAVVDPPRTPTATAAEALGAHPEAPPYSVEIACCPPRNVTVSEAVPPTTVLDPRARVPSKNLTVPEGMPPAGAIAVTVARRVTGAPCVGEVEEGESWVSVSPFSTRWASFTGPLAAKSPPPSYAAVMACIAGARDEVLHVALPPARLTEARVVPPSRNTTRPEGGPLAGAGSIGITIAVNATVSPVRAGLGVEVSWSAVPPA